MTLEKFYEEIFEYNFEEKGPFLKDCLEYLDCRTGELDDLYNELILNKYDSIEELIELIDSKEEVARAIYFGKIKNWCDEHFFFNSYGNIESENDYEYFNCFIDNKKEILQTIIEFIDEDDFEKIKDMDELINYIEEKIFY